MRLWRLWMALAARLHGALSLALIAVAFFVVVTPAAWLRRRFAKDALGLRIAPDRTCYWLERDRSQHDNLHDQF